MAIEAGFADSQGVVHSAYQLKAFEALVRADERALCAKLCKDDKTQAMDFMGATRVGGYFAKKIHEQLFVSVK